MTKLFCSGALTGIPVGAGNCGRQSQGMVWVNTRSGVYHQDGEFCGKTKHGQFMTEDDARKAGHHAAKEPGEKKTAAAKAIARPGSAK